MKHRRVCFSSHRAFPALVCWVLAVASCSSGEEAQVAPAGNATADAGGAGGEGGADGGLAGAGGAGGMAGSSGGAGQTGASPIHFGVMLHLEAEMTFADQQQFQMFDKATREVIDLFGDHGGKITIESEMPYAVAAANWAKGDNALLYALSKGLGVGSHCDTIADQTAAADFAEHRTAVDAIVGAENNFGCSGGWVSTDWAKAATQGGFKFLDGVVMFAYLAVPGQNRPVNPDTGAPYTDMEIKQVYYHDPAPPDLMDRIHPRRLADTNDLDPDPGGPLLLLTGELGEIASLYEGRKNCFPSCELTQEDFDVVLSTIEQVHANKDHARFAMLYVHFPLNTLGPNTGPAHQKNTELVVGWLTDMSELEAEGKIEWVTQKEAYERFVANE